MTNNINGIDVSKYFIEVVDESGGTVDYKVLPNRERLLVEKIFEQNQQLARLQEENKQMQERLNNCEKFFNELGELLNEEVGNAYWTQAILHKIKNLKQQLEIDKNQINYFCTPKQQNKVTYCCYENVEKIENLINEVLEDR